MARRKKPRQLSSEEAELWRKVVHQVEKAAATPPIVHSQPVKPLPVVKHSPQPVIKPFRVGQKTRPTGHLVPSFSEHPAKTSPNMDKRNFQRLLKGKVEIDGTLDLHGLTVEQARIRLHAYVNNAHTAGYRLLLVITGKGKMSGYDEFNRPKIGVLKQGVPEWLKSAQLSSLVLQVTQAHGRHGGGGAYYVYLRRRR